MITVFILTAAFPYLPGEQFIEKEIQYWSSLPDTRVVVLPVAARGTPRPLPSNIRVDLALTHRSGILQRLVFAFLASVHPLFWKELGWLNRTSRLNAYCIARALLSTANALRHARALSERLEGQTPVDLVYAYWNDAPAFAAALLKREGRVRRLVSRNHGYDLYEEARKRQYMPLKRQFIADFDVMFAISGQGRGYLEERYAADPTRTEISRLGVSLPAQRATVSAENELKVLSVAFCYPEKRIDVAADAIAIAAARRPDLRIEWTHIGDGPLFDRWREYARTRLTSPNVSCRFMGGMSSDEVAAYYATHAVDVLLNTSQTEGLPVSIMEAMSYGVPVIAPAVGGIPEIVGPDCGTLLGPAPAAEEYGEALLAAVPALKNQPVRAFARHRIVEFYDAARNYAAFTRRLHALASAQPGS